MRPVLGILRPVLEQHKAAESINETTTKADNRRRAHRQRAASRRDGPGHTHGLRTAGTRLGSVAWRSSGERPALAFFADDGAAARTSRPRIRKGVR